MKTQPATIATAQCPGCFGALRTATLLIATVLLLRAATAPAQPFGPATAHAWGDGGSGQLGRGSAISSASPVLVNSLPDGRTLTSIAGGRSHSLGIANDGTAWAWGLRSSGQLGDGLFSPGQQYTPVQVNPLPGGRTFSAMAAGPTFSLAIANDGTGWAWGANASGQLGVGSTVNSATPQMVTLPDGRLFVAVAAGSSHSLALADDGTMWAWGNGLFGQLGRNSTADSQVPVQVNALPGGRIAIAVECGDVHSVALASDGTVWAWGSGSALGNGSTLNRLIPTQVNSLPDARTVVAISANAIPTVGSHTLALANDGTLWAWGSGGFGQLGNGATANSLLPVQVTAFPGGQTVIAISAGGTHSLAIADDGTIWAWGRNQFGQLGNASVSLSSVPLQVSGLPTGSETTIGVAGGGNHTLALTAELAGAPPVANSQTVTTCPETPVTITLNASDADGDPLTLTIDTPPGNGSLSGTAPNLIYAPDAGFSGSDAFVFTATDPGGLTATATVTINVEDNTAPVISLNGDDQITVECGSVFIDPGATAMDDCAGDLTASVQVTGAVNTSTPGIYLLSYQASDPSGNSANPLSRTVTVVDTTAPVITLNGSATLTLECGLDTYTEPGVTVTDACDPSLSVVIGGDTVDTSVLGTYVVTYDATDASGNVAIQVIRTVNVADTTSPVITLLAPASGHVEAVGNSIIFSADIEEACGLDQAAWKIRDFEGQETILAATVSVASGGIYAVGDAFSFAGAGIYSISLLATDAAGNQSEVSVVTDENNETLPACVVIYDPAGGFVTGGGWIWSPEGAFHPELVAFADVTGKATFGFVAKYKKGATVPTGNTEFQFHAADLNFKSTAYEWLVVAGKRAQYKGWGTINAEGNYRFMLTGIDGDLSGGDGNDRLRMKLWDEASGVVIYDNQANSDDNAELVDATAIQKGQIVIHKE